MSVSNIKRTLAGSVMPSPEAQPARGFILVWLVAKELKTMWNSYITILVFYSKKNQTLGNALFEMRLE